MVCLYAVKRDFSHECVSAQDFRTEAAAFRHGDDRQNMRKLYRAEIGQEDDGMNSDEGS